MSGIHPIATALILVLISAQTSLGQGDIPYKTGGVGKAEREAMYAVRSEYNLEVKSAITSGHYLGDVAITILDAAGLVVLEATTDGPLFYVKLPAGSYVVKGRYEDQLREQKVSIAGKGQLREVMLRFDGQEERATEQFETRPDAPKPATTPPVLAPEPLVQPAKPEEPVESPESHDHHHSDMPAPAPAQTPADSKSLNDQLRQLEQLDAPISR